MAGNLTQRAPQDASRINLSEDWELRYWTNALGVDEVTLRHLVKLNGDSAEAIRSALNK